MDGDNLSNGLGGHGKRVVSLAESGGQREVWIDLAQALVVDNKEGVDVLRHLLDTVKGLVNLLGTLEAEGDGDNTHGEDTHLLRNAGNNRGSTSAGATTHAGGDEGHTCTVAEHGLDVLKALLSSLAGTLGLVAGTETLGTELQMDGHGRIVECLCVGITKDESNVVDAFAVHVVDSIAATAADADNLNDAVLLLRLTEVEDIYCVFFHNFYYLLFT